MTSEAADEVEGDDAEAVELYAGGAATLLEQAAPRGAPSGYRVGGGGDDDGGIGGGGDVRPAPMDVDGETTVAWARRSSRRPMTLTELVTAVR